MALISVETALARILDGVAPLEEELVPITEAFGRVLATDLAAKHTQPSFRASAMDGYAVHGNAGAPVGGRWTVIGESAAGRGFAGAVGPGEAVRIFTGAPVPDGCGTVVIQENVARADDSITATDATDAGANIREAGNDFSAGATLLTRGQRLGAHTLTLAASMGYGVVPVVRRPFVAILATGDELVPPGTVPGPDQIVSSNPVGLAALVSEAGGTPHLLGIAADEEDALAASIAQAREGGGRATDGRAADILVTIGGASVGDHDLVAPVLQKAGMSQAFWKVAIRPGKPLMFGTLGAMRVMGLPGNPVSALITARTFLMPLIAALLGQPRVAQAREMATLTQPLDANGPRLHLMRAKLGCDAAGGLTVTPMPSQDSSLLSALAVADCLIHRAPDSPAALAGDRVVFERLSR